MNTSEQARILSKIATRNEAGRHFMEIYDTEALASLEADGLIEIYRQIHGATGIACSQEYWSVQLTDVGFDLVEANPED